MQENCVVSDLVSGTFGTLASGFSCASPKREVSAVTNLEAQCPPAWRASPRWCQSIQGWNPRNICPGPLLFIIRNTALSKIPSHWHPCLKELGTWFRCYTEESLISWLAPANHEVYFGCKHRWTCGSRSFLASKSRNNCVSTQPSRIKAHHHLGFNAPCRLRRPSMKQRARLGSWKIAPEQLICMTSHQKLIRGPGHGTWTCSLVQMSFRFSITFYPASLVLGESTLIRSRSRSSRFHSFSILVQTLQQTGQRNRSATTEVDAFIRSALHHSCHGELMQYFAMPLRFCAVPLCPASVWQDHLQSLAAPATARLSTPTPTETVLQNFTSESSSIWVHVLRIFSRSASIAAMRRLVGGITNLYIQTFWHQLMLSRDYMSCSNQTTISVSTTYLSINSQCVRLNFGFICTIPKFLAVFWQCVDMSAWKMTQ